MPVAISCRRKEAVAVELTFDGFGPSSDGRDNGRANSILIRTAVPWIQSLFTPEFLDHTDKADDRLGEWRVHDAVTIFLSVLTIPKQTVYHLRLAQICTNSWGHLGLYCHRLSLFWPQKSHANL
ncbi:MAG: hypothetical protein OXE94_15550 [Aestuariivita sp.]|nr:hypothetical protein [Aestuariivita sp.]MCY4201388.1 hypothetical protein [Aestuariivita sp.]MCY4290043.1 hypothetical protein [Aestuariivita sp.]MCY4346828.1 hypothetical protein [Aestuariivita sp.]